MATIQTNIIQIPLRTIIFNAVSASSGIKAVELVLSVMNIVNPVRFSHKDYQTELKKLIDDGEIVELEYVLPQLTYRIKSIYFPKGTEIEKVQKNH